VDKSCFFFDAMVLDDAMVVDSNILLPDTLMSCAQILGLPHIQRHLFICADQTNPKCCSKADSLVVWDYLKKRLKELGLDTPSQNRPTCTFRTKANCLRVCQQGPILVIYPEGVWYHSVTTTVIERIIQEHLLNNQIVKEFVFLVHPLPQTQPETSESMVQDLT